MDYQALLKLAESIAFYMAEGWRVDRRPVPQDEQHQGVKIIGDGGKTLRLYQSYQSKGKITVRGTCPSFGLSHNQQRNACLPHGSDSINISPTRNPKHIASDIERRLLPDYEAMLDNAAKTAQAYMEKISTLEHIEHAMLSISPELRAYQYNEVNTQRRYFLYGNNNASCRSGEIRLSASGGYSCDFDLNDVPLSTAFKILAILKEDSS